MANELNAIQQSGLASGRVQATVRRLSDLKMRYSVGPTFEANNDAHVASYGITLADKGGDLYAADMPADVTAGSYQILVYYVPAGTLLTTSDVIKSYTLNWNGGAVTGSVTGTGFLTITDLLQIMQTAARNAGKNTTFNNDPYSLTDGHVALAGALKHFIRETRCTRQTDSAVLTEDDNALDFSAVAAFHPERILRAWCEAVDTDSSVQTPPISLVDHDLILRERLCSVQTGAPTMLGFTSLIDAIVNKNADQNYNVFLQWFPPLVSFTAGDTNVGSTQINVPGDMADYVARTAAVVFLQGGQPQQIKEGRIAELWQQYEEYVATKRGTGNYGSRSIRRRSLREM